MDVAAMKQAIKKLPSWGASPARSVVGDLSRVLSGPNWHCMRPRRSGLRGPDEPMPRDSAGQDNDQA
eukprot:6630306-Pyramimonas_sp.AAC.1